MEDMRSRVSVCAVIILHIGGVIALKWTNVSTRIIACEHENILIHWEYDLSPGEYVKAKTWFTGFNKTARRIAYWKDTDGITIESQYKDRVIPTGNNSLILRDVRIYDEGPYTLIPSFPLSPEPDPRLTVNLEIFISPLKEPGCCKPDINASSGELLAFLHSTLACGKPTPTLAWTISRNKTVLNGSLIIGTEDRAGTYKVCAVGPAVDRCFTVDKEYLCKSYTVERSPEIDQLKSHDSNQAMTIGVSISVVVAVTTAIAVLVAVLYRRALRRNRKRLGETLPFISQKKDETGVKSLTLRLIDIYKERQQFKEAESDLKLKVKLHSRSSNEQDIDINSYATVLCMKGNPLKRILITGEVGCGKKTWCNNLTQHWCNAQSDNVSDADCDNIEFLSNFKLLFNVSLKNVKKLSNINELLTHLRIPLFDTLNKDTSKHLWEHKAIFVIQGLEEYTGSPEDIQHILLDEKLAKSLIIATSTPTLWDNKYKHLFDRIISVKGLDQDEMKKRAQRILLANGFPQKAIDNFFSLIREKGLDEFTTEPVFFPPLVAMWQTNCSLPSNKADFLLNVIENKIKKESLFLAQNTTKYRSDLFNSFVFKNKEFTRHYGKIMQVIGEIAFNILCNNNEHVTFDENQFDTILINQDCNDKETQTFMKVFCVRIGLVSKEEDENIQKFSFRHIMLQTFAAALYVSTLGNEQRIAAAEKLKSVNNFLDILNFINPN